MSLTLPWLPERGVKLEEAADPGEHVRSSHTKAHYHLRALTQRRGSSASTAWSRMLSGTVKQARERVAQVPERHRSKASERGD